MEVDNLPGNKMVEEKDQTWTEFTQEVTMHGIKYVHMSASSWPSRVVWLTIILVLISYSVYASHGFIDACRKRETSARFRNIRVDSLEFPMVVLCSRNSFTRHAIKKVSSEKNLTGLGSLIESMYYPNQKSIDWTSPKYKNLYNLSSEHMEQVVSELAPTPESMILHTIYENKLLQFSQVYRKVKTDIGYCYAFNAEGQLKARSTSLYSGLRITLNTSVDEYYIGPGAEASGFYVAIYRPGEIPNIMGDGIVGVTPGTLVNIALEMHKIKRQPPPADDNTADCFDTKTEPNPLSIYPNYSYNACYRECSTNYSVDKFGCRNFYDPLVDGAKICKPDKLITSTHDTIFSDITEKIEFLKKSCRCRNTCDEEYYSTEVSTFKFPNEQFFRRAFNYNETTMEDLKKNLIQLTINFKSMSYNSLEEYLPYTWSDAIANFGGTMGLCIGASLLTICEFIQFGVFSLIRCINRKREQESRKNVIHVQMEPTKTRVG